MFLLIFLGGISTVLCHYICPANITLVPVTNIVSFAKGGYVQTSDMTPPATKPVHAATVLEPSDDVIAGFSSPVMNTAPAADIRSAPGVVTGIFRPVPFSQQETFAAETSPILTFITTVSAVVASNSDLFSLFNLHEIPKLQLTDAYFHTIEDKLKVFHVPGALNISCVVSKTIGSVADDISSPSYENAVLKASGKILIAQGILNTENALVLAQMFATNLENALNAARAAGSVKPHIDGLINGGVNFFSSVGVSIHDYANTMAETLDNELNVSKQFDDH